jgi:[ribosomal protein S5]-alanine N-acetyltransferase
MRPMELMDAANFFELNADPEVVRYLGIPPMHELQQAIDKVQLVLEQYDKFGIGRYAILEKSTGKFIGFGGLKFFERAAPGYENIYDLGYVLARDAWGKGYATEIARVWIDQGFNTMHLPEIYGMTDPDNETSKKILLKVGLHYIENISFEDMDTCLFMMRNPASA